MRPEIETKLCWRHRTAESWRRLFHDPSVMPGTEIRNFILGQLFGMIDSTIEILATVHELVSLNLVRDPWMKTACDKAVANASTLEDWVWVWVMSIWGTHRAESEIRRLCQDRAAWEHLLQILDNMRGHEFGDQRLYKDALRNVGWGDEVEDDDPDSNDDLADEDPALVLLRSMTSSLPERPGPIGSASASELQRRVAILYDRQALPETHRQARAWIEGCELPFSDFLAVAEHFKMPTTDEERLVEVLKYNEFTPSHPVFKKLAESASTLDECCLAWPYVKNDPLLARKLTAFAKTPEDWVNVWHIGTQSENSELQQLALANVLERASD
jgi:hypothetical protein